MPFLFSFSLITERNFSLNAVSIILLAGPLGLLTGNRVLVPRTARFSPKTLMRIAHTGFAVSLSPIIVFQAIVQQLAFAYFFLSSLIRSICLHVQNIFSSWEKKKLRVRSLSTEVP
ncbi:hypothetical protein EML15_05220 [Corynebacterium sp. sy017]|uniref:hypothetical protein n=1 Tax=unclassified Corynebacterium TaxID=2624378 RepID=UPI00118560CF|nr:MULTISPECIES: hypothetical protein [unclassified Corynebacterium]MBP3088546.1 hypothetical protein [Corynebacterium sp. sy017]TSD91847.1 hypothetical protein ELY17_05220 [Corynebacterium sp. SY003]